MNVVTATRRVVIADDVADLRILLRVALEQTGRFDVVAEAADGARAIIEVEAHRPDLVVLDLSMPVLDGLEALPRILAAAPDTRVVVLSGFSAARMRDQVLSAGAIAYLEKGDIFASVAAIEALL